LSKQDDDPIKQALEKELLKYEEEIRRYYSNFLQLGVLYRS
jgi:hypothetical protein